MKKLLFFSFIVCLGLSCKKNTDSSCTTTTASISGPYKITAITYKANASAAEADYLNTIFSDACQRDDIYTFSTNGTYTIADAGSVCSPPGDDNGTWALSGNTMTIDGNPATVASFDCKTLVFIINDSQVAGDQLKFTLTRQ